MRAHVNVEDTPPRMGRSPFPQPLQQHRLAVPTGTVHDDIGSDIRLAVAIPLP